MARQIVESRPRTDFQSVRFPRDEALSEHVAGARRQQASVKASPVALLASATVIEAFRVIASNCIEQFLANRAAFFIGASPESVHQMRVAIRRLRSLLSFHRRALQQDDYERLRMRLKRVFALLGEARSLDVLIDHIALGAVSCDEADLRKIATARERAYGKVEALLGSRRLSERVRRLKRWLTESPLDALVAAAPVKPHAKDILRRQYRNVRRFNRAVGRLDTERLHRLRIHAKKLRYACEFFRSAFPDSVRRQKALFKTLEKLQDSLGASNDIATFNQMEFAGRPVGGWALPAKDAEKLAATLRRASIKALRGVLDAPQFWKPA